MCSEEIHCMRCNGNHVSMDCPYYKKPNKTESKTYCFDCKRITCRCFPYKTFVSDKLDVSCKKNELIVNNWIRKYNNNGIINNDVNGLITKFTNMTEYDSYLDFKEYKKVHIDTCNEIILLLRYDRWCSFKEIKWDERSLTGEFYKYQESSIKNGQWTLTKKGIVIKGHCQRFDLRTNQEIEDIKNYTQEFGFYDNGFNKV
eukprot:489960_1